MHAAIVSKKLVAQASEATASRLANVYKHQGRLAEAATQYERATANASPISRGTSPVHKHLGQPSPVYKDLPGAALGGGRGGRGGGRGGKRAGEVGVECPACEKKFASRQAKDQHYSRKTDEAHQEHRRKAKNAARSATKSAKYDQAAYRVLQDLAIANQRRIAENKVRPRVLTSRLCNKSNPYQTYLTSRVLSTNNCVHQE
jgi:hypothetical protein